MEEQSIKEAESVFNANMKTAKEKFSSCYTSASTEFKNLVADAASQAAQRSKELLIGGVLGSGSDLGEPGAPQVVVDCSGQGTEDCEELPVTDCK